MTARFLSLASAVFLLTACNSGDSFLEWDEETAAMLAAQEAAAEQEAAGQSGAAADGDVGLVMPLAILRDSGELEFGELAVVPPSGDSRRATATMASGDICSGGLVGTGDNRGTFALSCESGTIWLGDYIFAQADLGSAVMRDHSSAPARMVYGADAADIGAGLVDFESVWASREAMAMQE